IREEVDEEANIIFGSAIDESLQGKIRVSVVATGIDSPQQATDARPRLVAVGGSAMPMPVPIPLPAQAGMSMPLHAAAAAAPAPMMAATPLRQFSPQLVEVADPLLETPQTEELMVEEPQPISHPSVTAPPPAPASQPVQARPAPASQQQVSANA